MSIIKQICLICFVLLFVTFLSGCIGLPVIAYQTFTPGFHGSIKTLDGQPVPNVKITLISYRQKAICYSDQKGDFYAPPLRQWYFWLNPYGPFVSGDVTASVGQYGDFSICFQKDEEVDFYLSVNTGTVGSRLDNDFGPAFEDAITEFVLISMKRNIHWKRSGSDKIQMICPEKSYPFPTSPKENTVFTMNIEHYQISIGQNLIVYFLEKSRNTG